MNSSLITLERLPHPINLAPVLNRNGFTCTLLTLAPDTETALPASHSPDEQLLFVVEGGIRVRTGDLTTIVNAGGAIVLPAGGIAPVCALGGGSARLLRVEIPPRRVITPQIITPGN